MTAKYAASIAVVREKQEEVKAIKANIANMESELQTTRNFIDKLRNDKEMCERRL